MRLNPFHISKLGEAIIQRFRGESTTELFSTSKESLFLVFENQQALKILFIDGEAHFQLIDFDKLPKRNRLPQFQALHGKALLNYLPYPLDRQFSLEFEGGYFLHFTLFGRFSQLTVFSGDVPVAHFPLSQRSLDNFPKADIRLSDHLDELKKIYPFITDEMIDFLKAADYNQSQDKAALLMRMEAHFRKDYGIIHELPDSTQSDFLMQVSKLHTQLIWEKLFNQKKKKLIKQAEQEIKKLHKAVKTAERNKEESLKRISFKLKADLLMANLHQVPKGAKKVKLLSFDGEEEIELKLNPLLSPQENAGKYYQKSKNEGKKIAFIEQQIAEHQKELEQAQDKLLEIQNTSDIKGLQQFEKGVKSSAEPKVRLPYKRFDWNGLEIRVGKSAKDNDELLRSYSSSHDLWFHAAGVSGSHVILRLSKNQQIGEDIIEKVAGLAAYYSKARKESLAKVVYTFRKFVRKPKGGAVGAVLIEKENSLLIEPSQEL